MTYRPTSRSRGSAHFDCIGVRDIYIGDTEIGPEGDPTKVLYGDGQLRTPTLPTEIADLTLTGKLTVKYQGNTLSLFSDGNGHIECNSPIWVGFQGPQEVNFGGPVICYGQGVRYAGVGGNHNIAYTWDSTAICAWVDGNLVGRLVPVASADDNTIGFSFDGANLHVWVNGADRGSVPLNAVAEVASRGSRRQRDQE